MHDNDGAGDSSTWLWTEELAPIEVTGAGGASMLTLRTSLTPVGGSALHGALDLRGELCPETTPVLADAADRLVDLGVVDMSFDLVDLRLCTSEGVDLWCDLATRLGRDGGDVRLRNASGGVRRVLAVCGLLDSGRA